MHKNIHVIVSPKPLKTNMVLSYTQKHIYSNRFRIQSIIRVSKLIKFCIFLMLCKGLIFKDHFLAERAVVLRLSTFIFYWLFFRSHFNQQSKSCDPIQPIIIIVTTTAALDNGKIKVIALFFYLCVLSVNCENAETKYSHFCSKKCTLISAIKQKPV